MEMMQETSQLLDLPKGRNDQKPPRQVCKWSKPSAGISSKKKKPSAGIIKLNSDGGFLVEDGIAASGVVVRDSVSFRGTLSKIYRWISSPGCRSFITSRCDSLCYGTWFQQGGVGG
jgi:hypothetical protein